MRTVTVLFLIFLSAEDKKTERPQELVFRPDVFLHSIPVVQGGDALKKKPSRLFLEVPSVRGTEFGEVTARQSGVRVKEGLVSAGSLAYPETGIGIYPGLGGMLRLARQIGVPLAKYYVFTGASITAEDALHLGLVSAVVSPVKIDEAIQALVSEGRPDKYRARPLPEKFNPLLQLFSGNHLDKILSGKVPEQVSAEIGAKILKVIGYKAPCALKIAAEIIDAQQDKPFSEAIEIELGRLAEMFSTTDALEGLSSLGRRRPQFIGK